MLYCQNVGFISDNVLVGKKKVENRNVRHKEHLNVSR